MSKILEVLNTIFTLVVFFTMVFCGGYGYVKSIIFVVMSVPYMGSVHPIIPTFVVGLIITLSVMVLFPNIEVSVNRKDSLDG